MSRSAWPPSSDNELPAEEAGQSSLLAVAMQASSETQAFTQKPGNAASSIDEATAQMLAALQVELAAEAKAASASRLLVGHMQVARVTILLDLHASQGKHGVPLSIDTNR